MSGFHVIHVHPNSGCCRRNTSRTDMLVRVDHLYRVKSRAKHESASLTIEQIVFGTNGQQRSLRNQSFVVGSRAAILFSQMLLHRCPPKCGRFRLTLPGSRAARRNTVSSMYMDAVTGSLLMEVVLTYTHQYIKTPQRHFSLVKDADLCQSLCMSGFEHSAAQKRKLDVNTLQL